MQACLKSWLAHNLELSRLGNDTFFSSKQFTLLKKKPKKLNTWLYMYGVQATAEVIGLASVHIYWVASSLKFYCSSWKPWWSFFHLDIHPSLQASQPEDENNKKWLPQLPTLLGRGFEQKYSLPAVSASYNSAERLHHPLGQDSPWRAGHMAHQLQQVSDLTEFQYSSPVM